MKKSSTIILLASAWILGMLCLYYWGHKPFDLDQVLALCRVALDLVIVTLVIILAGGTGKRLMGLRRDKQSGSMQQTASLWSGEQAVLQAVAGLGVMSLLWLLLGVLGLYYRITAWIVLLSGLALFRKDCLAWLKDISSFKIYWQKGRKFDRVLIISLFFLLILQVIWAAAPPIKYDALTYHLQLPRQYLAEHRFVFVADNPYWGHPQLGEMLFTWMMLLHRTETCALMGAGWGFLTLLGVMGTIRRVLSSRSCEGCQSQTGRTIQEQADQQGTVLRAGLIAAVALICGATFRSLLSWAYVDLLSALMGWAALAALLTVFEENAGKWGIWAGIFCGFAIGTKWTAGIAAIVVFLFLFGARKKAGISWRNLFIAAGMTVIVVTPWLVKNIIATGSPVYPYFFATPLISEQRLQAANIPESPVGLADGLLFPVTSTIFGWDSAAGFGTDLGPLLAMLAIPGLWLYRRRPAGRVILTGLVLCWAVILIGSQYFNYLQQTRLYFVLLPWAGVAAGLGWEYLAGLKSKVLRIEMLISTFILLALAFVSFQELARMVEINPLQAVVGLDSQDEYVARAVGWYFPAVNSIKELPEGSKVLMLWEARGYYAPFKNTTFDLWIDRWRNDYWTYGSAENILNSWRLQGYTHVLFYKSGAEMIRESENVLETEGWNELDRLTGLLPEPRLFGDAYELYSLIQ